MKSVISNILTFAICSVSTAFAASGAESDGSGPLLWVFVGFAATVIAFQFLPGILMFLGMSKGIFSSRKTTSETSKS